MPRPQVKIAFFSVLLLAAALRTAVAQGAAVSGVVRDAQGVAQLGALVQVFAADSAQVGTAFTDLHGRYFIPHLLPGRYEVQASAALFVPAMRANLQLRAGAQAVVNLTLNTLFESTTWIPAERRKADEPSDDWKWTLRSAANRPILRLNEDGDVLVVSSSSTESPKRTERGRAEVTSGDGGFGNNGIHNAFRFDRALDDGADLSMYANIGTQIGESAPSAPSTEVSSRFESRLGFAGADRAVLSYQSHPELVSTGGTPGLQAMQLASAQQMQLGDTVEVEAGSTVYVVRTYGNAAAMRPFLKVTVHPKESWTVGYRMATSRDLQSFAGLDALQQELPVAVMYRGKMQTEDGLHQEFVVGKKVGQGTVQVGYYRDALGRVAVSGGGTPITADMGGGNGQPITDGVLTDVTNGTFRLLGTGYSTSGVHVTLSEPLNQNMWIAVEYGTGAGLSQKDGVAMSLSTVSTSLTPEMAQTATLALRGTVVHTGTKVRASYHWQPARIVTAVDPYAAFSDEAYLSCTLRQALRFGKLLPSGLEATVDVSNLLAQGYRPFLSADGHTLFLAQTPRTVQAGLAFTF